MILIGEKLNSSIKSSYEAMLTRDENILIDWIKAQHEADYLDINTAMFTSGETERMLWLCDLVTEHSDAGISIDSQNVDTILTVTEHCKGRKLLINSVTSEEKFFRVWELAAKINCGVICMPTDRDRMRDISLLVDRAKRHGIPMENLYLDVAVGSIAADDQSGKNVLDRIRECKALFPECHIVCGLSNLSFGMPGREVLNATMLAMAAAVGLDAAILNVMDPMLLSTLAAIKLLQGEDEYGLDYIEKMKNV